MKHSFHTTLALTILMYGVHLQHASAAEISLKGIDGPVTSEEVASFTAYMRTVRMPADNEHNALVYGSGGTAVEAVGIVYEISHERELLDRLVGMSDQILAVRNDPETGRVLWTGKRELVWPNKREGTPEAAYTGTENGDVVGHMLYAAQLILQDKTLWGQAVAGGDPHGYGKTYLDRAKTYVKEADRTVDLFILPQLVQKGTNRYYFPTSDALAKSAGWPGGGHEKPVPWNQQMMLNNGMMRLAICHDLLGDDPARVKQCDAIVKASVEWFLGSVKTYQAQGHDCYRWTYAVENPMKHIEDVGHGGYDMLVYRAYASGRYGITTASLAPFANTVQHVMYKGESGFAMRVDGTSKGADRQVIGATWLFLGDISPLVYPLLAKGALKSAKAQPLMAAMILWARNKQVDRRAAETVN